MGVIAYFGSERFEVSNTRALPINEFKRQTAGRYNSFDRIGKKPLTDYTGPGLDQIGFTVDLKTSLGVEPRDVLDHWASLADAGTTNILVLGGKVIGSNLWLVKSVSQTWGEVDGNGRILSATMELAFEEYVEK